MRFSLLESLRAFASEQLTLDERAAVSERHACWFTDVAEQFDATPPGAAHLAWLERINADLDNFRAALEHDLFLNPERAVQSTGALWMYWHLRGRPTEGRNGLERALAANPTPEETEDTTSPVLFRRGRALHGAGTLANIQGDTTAAQPHFEEALRLRRKIGDKIGLSSTLNNMGLMVWNQQGAEAARPLLNEGLLLRREAGASASLIASSLQNLAVMDWERGDYESSRVSATEALTLFRESDDRVGEGHALNNLGNLALAFGDFENAEKYHTQSLEIKRALGYLLGTAMTLTNIGVAALYQEHYEKAKAHFEESLALHREINHPSGIALQLCNLGKVAVAQKEEQRAFDLLAESLAITRKADAADDFGGILEGFAQLAIAQNKPEHAARLLGAAATRRAEIKLATPPSERAAVNRATTAAQTALGGEPFDRLYQEGEGLTAEEAEKLALST